MPDDKTKFQVFLSTARSVLALFRESAIIFLILFIIIWPDALQNVLKRAGFSELDLGFLKWQKEIEAAKQDAQDANQILDKVQQDISETQKSIDTIRNSSNLDDETKENINKLSARLEKSYSATSKAKDNLIQNIERQTKILSESPQAISSGQEGTFAIVVGADKDENGARHELNKYRRLGYDKVQIFIKSGWYRTLVLFEDQKMATKELTKIQKVRESAFIVNLATWCSRSVEKETGVLYECR